MQTFKKFFSAPTYVDEETTRRAGLLSFVLNLHILVTLSTTFIMVILVREAPIFSVTALIASLLGFGLRALMWRGRIRLASIVFLGTAFLLMPTLAWFSKSSVATVSVTAFQVMTVVMAGLLLGGRSASVFVLMTAVFNGALIYAELHGIYIPNPARNLVTAWFMQIIAFSAITGMLFVTNSLIRESYARANKENDERRAREQELEQVIHEKTQAEEKIYKLNQELQREIAELERFTYTVSHDLRNPLVTIKGFLGMLDKDLQEKREDRVKNDFQRIAGATEKMGELLTDLLELSRIGRIVNPPTEVDLVKLTQEALESLDARVRAKNVAVIISPDLPIVYGDHIRLREVLENLIDNAAKCMDDQPNPLIEIGVRNQGDEQIIFIKDNGIGIEPKYQTRIFGLFEKLNPAIEGTGIGLALVKRIIEVHGGRIWVESDGLGKGSTFCFTIPDGRKTA